MSADNKTEQATPRRLQKAREQGQVARSQELPSALVALAVSLFLGWKMPAWGGQWRQLFVNTIGIAPNADFSPSSLFLQQAGMVVLDWTLPVLLIGWSVALVSMLAQGGFVFAPAALSPNWGRLNPGAQISQMMSLAGLNRLLKSVLPLCGILYLSGTILVREWARLVEASALGVDASLAWIFLTSFEMSWKTGLWLLALSGVDYFLQRMRMERGLRMSRQEIREEMKDLEGSPTVRLRVRQLRREMRRRRMLHDVSQATVVVTNPTEYAVALRYQPESMGVPIVVAKGRDHLARQIKRLARSHDVPVVENRPLAQALYRSVKVGQAIPVNLYAAVAELLAFLFRTHGLLREEGEKPTRPAAPGRA